MSEKSEYVTIREAAEIARVSYRTVQRWIEKGAVKAKRSAGSKWLILRSEVEPK